MNDWVGLDVPVCFFGVGAGAGDEFVVVPLGVVRKLCLRFGRHDKIELFIKHHNISHEKQTRFDRCFMFVD